MVNTGKKDVTFTIFMNNGAAPVKNLNFQVQYNALLEYKGYAVGSLTRGFDKFEVSEQNGVLTIGWQDDTGIAGSVSGDIVRLNFQIDGGCPTSDITNPVLEVPGLSPDMVVNGSLFNKLGDVNGDNRVSNSDFVSILKHVAGEDVSPFYADLADVNGDGSVDVDDALLVRQMAEKSITSGCDVIVPKVGTLSIGNHSVDKGKKVKVPITINLQAGEILKAFNLKLSFDSNILKYQGYTEGDLSNYIYHDKVSPPVSMAPIIGIPRPGVPGTTGIIVSRRMTPTKS